MERTIRRYADDPLIWMIVGGVGFGVLGIWNSSGPLEFLLWVLGGIVVLLVAFSFYLDPQPHTESSFTTARPPAIRAQVRRRFGDAPWVSGLDESNELIFWRQLRPNLFVAIFLGIFGVIPAIIYVVVALKSTQSVKVFTEPTTGGTTLTVTIRPRSHDGRRIANRLVNNIVDLGNSSGQS